MEKENKYIEIRPTGSYFETDEEGYLINPTSLDKIQEQYKPVIEDIIEIYKKHFGDNLHSVYVRGSVAKGEAVLDVSDVDTFAYIKEGEEKDGWWKDSEKEIENKYSFIQSVELFADKIPEDFKTDQYIFLNQSICVFGENIKIPKLKPGKEMAFHAPDIQKRLNRLKNFLKEEKTDEEIKKYCVWFMKGILRSGFEITMERSKRYTRDLYKCYETFSEYYPEKEAQMKEILYYAINPISSKEKIKNIVKDISNFLIEEAKKHV